MLIMALVLIFQILNHLLKLIYLGRQLSTWSDRGQVHVTYELTQDKIDCRIIDSITISKRLQPCPHLLYGMDYRWLMSDV